MQRILILGAHTAMSRAIVECVEERELDIKVELATTTEHVGPGLDLIDASRLAAADAVILAARGPVLEEAALSAWRAKKPVLDVAEAFTPGDRAEYVWPGLAQRPTALDRVGVVPVGPASPIVAALVSLTSFSPRAVTVTTLESAACRDQEGMDDLAEHVRSVFSMKETHSQVFGVSLAFDVVPWIPGFEREPAAADDRLADAVAQGLAACARGPLQASSFTRLLVPTFSADGLVLAVDLEVSPSRDEAVRAVASGSTLRWTDAPLPALDVVGREDVLAVRLRVQGPRVDLVLFYDRLRRGGATQATLWLEELSASDRSR